MKVLVTGATGFIGYHLIKNLSNSNGLKIIATGTKPIKNIKKKWDNTIPYKRADLNIKRKNWYSYFNAPDLLIHLAWQGLPNYNDRIHIEKNFPSSCDFIENLIRYGTKKIVVIGTCFEYGMVEGELNEQMESKPENKYAKAKDMLRKHLQKLQKTTKFDLTWLRLFYTYGTGQGPNSIISQLENSIKKKEKIFNMSNGDQLRDYLPVNLLVDYIAKISLNNKVTGIVNCCSGQPISIKNLVEDYLRLKKYEIKLNLGFYPYPDFEPMNFWGSNSKLLKAINNSQ
tara:strand:- start:3704 stop:4558 length:855 start_codon:yes stop_codon:yes gene_type:complete